MAGIADQFAGLPIEDLIVSPMIGMVKGQAKLNEVTWDYINEVAFVKDKDGKATARALDVEMNRVMTDGTTGEQSLQKIYSKVPMLPLVPLPSLAITSADINFTMEVKSSDMSKSSTDASVSSTVSGGYKGWGFSAKFSVTGKVATHKENTRSTDNSAKYTVHVEARDDGAPEGLMKVLDILGSAIQPVSAGGGGGGSSSGGSGSN